jgi:WD40 repeat protein
MPLAIPLFVPDAGEEVERIWHVNGVEAGQAVRLTGNRGLLPEGTYAFPQGVPLSPLSLVRADIVEESRSTFRAGSANVTLSAGEAADCGAFGWRADYDFSAALSPSLHHDTAANNGGTGIAYSAKAIAAGPSGLIAVSGLDGEGALHVFAAAYGAELDPALAGPGKVLSIDASWIRLWRDRIKIGGSYKTADRLAVSNDGRFIASASSSSDWIHLCSLDSNGALLATFATTAVGDIRALCFSPDGGRLYAAANSTKTIYAFNVGETGISPAWSTPLTNGTESLSFQDMAVTGSGSIIVTAKDASRIYILSYDGSFNAEKTIQGASGGTDPYHPGALAISGQGDAFYVLCDERKIIRFSRADSLSTYAPDSSFILPAEAEGSCFIAAGTRSGETSEIVAAAGGANIEFFEIGVDGNLLNVYPLRSAPGVPAGTQMSDMLCFARGAYLLSGGTSGIVSVFGAD